MEVQTFPERVCKLLRRAPPPAPARRGTDLEDGVVGHPHEVGGGRDRVRDAAPRTPCTSAHSPQIALAPQPADRYRKLIEYMPCGSEPAAGRGELTGHALATEPAHGARVC
jgi:hypothetical protein